MRAGTASGAALDLHGDRICRPAQKLRLALGGIGLERASLRIDEVPVTISLHRHVEPGKLVSLTSGCRQRDDRFGPATSLGDRGQRLASAGSGLLRIDR